MTPIVPDCGVLTTPRRTPPIKLDTKIINKSPLSGLLPYKSPPRTAEEVGVKLSSGISFSFYKTPKRIETPPQKVDAQPVVQRSNKRRPKDGINKGVFHKIKKPKPTAKKLKKKTRDMKTTTKRLKEGNYIPCPWLPSNRSPLKRRPKSNGKKKHILASPGVSLLEDEDFEELNEDTPENKKFFTSRSRATATVNINKNVLLASKNGDIILNQREGNFLKKNIGRVVEEQLDKFIHNETESTSENQISPQTLSSLPSVTANPRPMPTRVPATPSPPKKQLSPRKMKRLFNPNSCNVNREQCQENGSPIRRSPRKLIENCTPEKHSKLSSPLRKSPRKNVSSPMKISKCNLDSPQKKTANATVASEVSPKVFAVFDPERRRSDVELPSKIDKSASKHFGIPKSNYSQMIIDAGQKEFGIRQCKECGVVYEVANKEDEANHELHHNSINNSLKFISWKNENIVKGFDELGGRILMVASNDPLHCWRKVAEVLKVVDEELGFSENNIPDREKARAFLYVCDRKIVGCLIAERIDKANRVIPSDSKSSRLLCCSEEQTKAWAGISRLWVLISHRGKGIASKLVDSMRCNMYPKQAILDRDQIAFSDPTENGTVFAEKYTGKRDFLVYRRS